MTHHALTARRVCTPPPLWCRRGGHTRWVERGWGVNIYILEDARHCSVLYICKYFVQEMHHPRGLNVGYFCSRTQIWDEITLHRLVAC
jgi:hypothetical protein